MKNTLLIALTVLLCWCNILAGQSQTLYVPNSTSGIGSSSNGNVGVGTSTPQSKLEVGGGKITVSYLNTEHNNGNSIPMLGSTFPGLTDFGSGLNTLIENAGSNRYGLQFVTRESWQIASSPKMTVQGNGNVGIGTIAPQSKFEVRGTSIRLSDDDTRYLEISQDASGTAFGRTYSNGYAGARQFLLSGWSHQPDNSGSIKRDIVQFDGYNLNLLKDNGGNVGIGTAAPLDKLSVVGNISIPLQNSIGFGQSDRFTYDNKSIGNYSVGWYGDSENSTAPTSYFSGFGGIKFFTAAQSRMTILNGGNVGIATTSPSAKLEINETSAEVSALKISDFTIVPQLLNASWNPISKLGDIGIILRNSKSLVIAPHSGSAGGLRISANGNVGIGTGSPDKTLTVKGTIHTNEVLVDLNVQAPDYVFEKNYNLLPLSQLESYINQNKHLPEVPSAKEMEENGLNLKEMNLILLKKVEELTLYVLELKNENQEIKNELKHVKNSRD
jgi:hypothetical protein